MVDPMVEVDHGVQNAHKYKHFGHVFSSIRAILAELEAFLIHLDHGVNHGVNPSTMGSTPRPWGQPWGHGRPHGRHSYSYSYSLGIYLLYLLTYLLGRPWGQK